MPKVFLAVFAIVIIGCNSPLAGEIGTDPIPDVAPVAGSCWEFVDLHQEDAAAITWTADQHFLEDLIARKLLHFGADGDLQSWTVYRDAVALPPHCSHTQWQVDHTGLRLAAEDPPFTVFAHHDELVLMRGGYRWRYRKLPELPALTTGAALTAAELAGEWRLTESSGGPALPTTIAGYRLSFAADGSGRDDGRFAHPASFAIVDGTLMLTYDYVAQSTATVEVTAASREEEVVNRLAERRIAVWAAVADQRLTLLWPDPPALLRFERIR